MLPETTEDRVGFVHPYTGTLEVEESTVKMLLRDFELSGLDAKEQMIRRMAQETGQKFPQVKVTVDVKENYKNMKEVLKDHPQMIENAFEAARRAGLTPFTMPIRGGAARSLRPAPPSPGIPPRSRPRAQSRSRRCRDRPPWRPSLETSLDQIPSRHQPPVGLPRPEAGPEETDRRRTTSRRSIRHLPAGAV